mmetsp:Transcript_15283/g.29372  ORF Transcript_15283/g.29372 Transcript_15283/m.29372 type:complete len:178 (-) Transcript_15283:373-906(-)|eukprot:CAMPEP_0114279572 /NCGR_PEP_ID=MMETSP0059-20121206/1961_1 /TAXON_ID=36894 /ORGANISM="Pyramimonas parkeae, Strain CCMP726" /LENGTH=177 /DNA_ID=CAMNT_0001399885 /DNA_START=1407 /DNA_END=1940 /DNA_ORIENTATION=-
MRTKRRRRAIVIHWLVVWTDRLPVSGGVFYDLGSGSGRCVVSAALLLPQFTKVCGIEILQGLADLAIEVNTLYKHEIQSKLPEEYKEQKVSFVVDDILNADWSDADVVLVNSTCFSQQLFEKLQSRAARLVRAGALIITLTHQFHDTQAWEILEETERRMSWGTAKMFVHRRNQHRA